MWSLGSSACRSWRPHRLHQLLIAFTARRAAQCSFSTAPIAQAKATKRPKMDAGASQYGRWTKGALIKRIQALEYELRAKDQRGTPVVAATETTAAAATTTTTHSSSDGGNRIEPEAETDVGPQRKKKQKKQKKQKEGRSLDPSKYSTRLVALKLAYLGKNYGGFEYQNSANIPTIEEELWKAMVRACLIFPENPDEVNWDPWEYAKCGRTDRGVSAFGQVINIRMRSNRPLPKEPEETLAGTRDQAITETTAQDVGETETAEAAEKAPKREFNDITDELPYTRILNRLLPPDIRILAWCPTTPAEFSARHHCRERQYRYFFTQPAYSPMPSGMEDPKSRRSDDERPKNGWLDIEAMRSAARRFEGLHDFRNFCKIDGTKTQQSFRRRIFESAIVEAPDVETALPHLRRSEFQPSSSFISAGPSEPSTTASPPPPAENYPKVYYFHVRGSAFLWHQIRCMVSVLFMVGQGLEDVSVIDRLLDVAAEPRRPEYGLANETPLVLWDCLFPRDLDDDDPMTTTMTTRKKDDLLEWVYVGEDEARNAHGAKGLVDHVWGHWRDRKMDELLAGQLLGVVATQADLSLSLSLPRRNPNDAHRYAPVAQKMFEGGNRERSAGRYVPLLKRGRLASPQEAYDKEARRKGFENAAHMMEVMAQRKVEAEAEAAAGGEVTQVVGGGSGEMVE
ncbi:pseudouridine synthase [Xylaria acuta]|nr:pseudouridine synthase [Xylaria acuta]